jgi:ferritin-like metal-binding protein YciE
MYAGEKEVARALPLVAKAAKSKDLKSLVRIHLKETKGHVATLDQIVKSLGKKMPSRGCKPISKLVRDAVKVIAKRLITADQDMALIEVARKIEQFEISAYRPLYAEAQNREFTHEAAMLRSILGQEVLANELLGLLGQGKGPLADLIKRVSLQHAV